MLSKPSFPNGLSLALQALFNLTTGWCDTKKSTPPSSRARSTILIRGIPLSKVSLKLSLPETIAESKALRSTAAAFSAPHTDMTGISGGVFTPSSVTHAVEGRALTLILQPSAIVNELVTVTDLPTSMSNVVPSPITNVPNFGFRVSMYRFAPERNSIVPPTSKVVAVVSGRSQTCSPSRIIVPKKLENPPVTRNARTKS